MKLEVCGVEKGGREGERKGGGKGGTEEEGERGGRRKEVNGEKERVGGMQ